jgi:GDP-L-fucose synthase
MSFWSDRKVLVTGGSGFIGSHLVEELLRRGANTGVAARHPGRLRDFVGRKADGVRLFQGDLRDMDFARTACRGMDVVIDLAAQIAGVGYNAAHPATIFNNNAAIGLNVLDAATKENVERFLCVSSACVYRRDCVIPTPESEGFIDDPEPTNLGYGWAKRLLEVQARCYVQQFPIKIAVVRPYNAYGPRDNFDWETSHVIAALIRKAVEGHNPIVLWGDGSQTRSFLYVSDFVDGLLGALELYPTCDPVNIGSAEEVTVADLVRMIIRITGSSSQISFDLSKPAGQPRRRGDFTKAREHFGFSARVSLYEGLEKTIRWYKETRNL